MAVVELSEQSRWQNTQKWILAKLDVELPRLMAGSVDSIRWESQSMGVARLGGTPLKSTPAQ
jgi:hypothetical protein